MPRVSVLIPTYNHHQFIAEAIESVLQQTFHDVEILVADDSSTDGTSDIVARYEAEYPNKVRAVIGAKRLGIAGNMNRLLSLSSGEYIAWLGGDDFMKPSKLEEQVTYLDSHPDIIGCYHDADIYDQSLKSTVGTFSELYGRGKAEDIVRDISVLFDPVALILPSTVMVRSAFIPEHGFDARLRYTNDWLFDIETFRTGRISGFGRTLGVYRRHSSNVTGSAELAGIALEEQFMVLAIVAARYPELARLCKRRRISLIHADMIRRIRRHDTQGAGTLMKMGILEGSLFKTIFLFFGARLSKNLFASEDSHPYESKKLIRKVRAILKI